MIIRTMLVEDLFPAPYNPRKIGKDVLERLSKSLDKFGVVEPIVYNERTNRVVGGHQRLKALKALGVKEAPVSVVSLSDGDERALNLALNKVTGEWDDDALLKLLKDMDANFPDSLKDTGFSEKELALLIGSTGGGASDDDEVSVVSDTSIVPGDLFELGSHRLLCGDSTSSSDVARLMGGEKAIIMVTDPPYGVEYNPSWRNETNLKNGIKRPTRAEGKVSNDDKADWREAWELFTGDIAYVWHAGKYASTVQASLEGCGFDIINQIIWAKPHFILSRGDYHWKHEPCWYAVRKGANHNWQGSRTQTTVWDIAGMNCFGKSGDEEDYSTGHGTQKPMDCMSIPIMNNSVVGDGVYDPFIGSGTTLIACERTKRKCYAMEIDPNYCQVTINRWEKLTGKKANKL